MQEKREEKEREGEALKRLLIRVKRDHTFTIIASSASWLGALDGFDGCVVL